MAILFLYYLYHLVFFMVSLGISRPAPGTPGGAGLSRLAVFIPAHDEETVIYQTVQSILASDYPKGKLDVFVIADNCADRTEELAQNAGARVLRREHKTLRGKQHALAWAFKQIDLEKYQGVIVLDADNRVEPGFIRVMDRHLTAGHKVVQGYVETKNPGDSWITANYAYMFWYMCRLQMARTRLGLSAWLAGTGLCISTEIIRRVGWNVKTLVDDVEYTCQLLLAGERVVFAPGAVVYDQKPVGLRDSMKQRLRWIRGQTQVTMRYVPRLAFQVLRSWVRGDVAGALRAFDGIMWVPMHLVVLGSFITSLLMHGPIYFVSAILSVPVLYFLLMAAEKTTNVRAWAYLATAGMFYFTWIPITAYGAVTHGKQGWWRTPHQP
ncbi:Beta-monoglucosyldiacylglycerol synthase [Pelotomaculum sp. FP]|uniref:glycosyltransferase family 2 protein n=1 Tax=Pelotomaculum sp. FP TaxID=261474 RepID=UPI001064C8E6|nr:glycosyltransferase family 2 protein [Pelotomaculum sp. FP]TEB15167.1 Beta-monoglucosyldiacylglycerol synthase [Pelotomaculum sp. FP]